MYVLHRDNRWSLRLCCRPARTQRWNKRYIDTDLVTLGRIKGTTNIRAKMHAKDTNPGTSTLTNIGSPFSCSLTKIPLPQPERYDSFLSGEKAGRPHPASANNPLLSFPPIRFLLTNQAARPYNTAQLKAIPRGRRLHFIKGQPDKREAALLNFPRQSRHIPNARDYGV